MNVPTRYGFPIQDGRTNGEVIFDTSCSTLYIWVGPDSMGSAGYWHPLGQMGPQGAAGKDVDPTVVDDLIQRNKRLEKNLETLRCLTELYIVGELDKPKFERLRGMVMSDDQETNLLAQQTFEKMYNNYFKD